MIESLKLYLVLSRIPPQKLSPNKRLVQNLIMMTHVSLNLYIFLTLPLTYS